MEKIYGMHKLVGLQLFWSRTPTFSSGTPTFCQMGVLNSCFQNPSESSGSNKNLFWSIKNSGEILDKLKARDFNVTSHPLILQRRGFQLVHTSVPMETWRNNQNLIVPV